MVIKKSFSKKGECFVVNNIILDKGLAILLSEDNKKQIPLIINEKIFILL